MRALGFSDALEPKRRGGGKKHAAESGCRAQANTVRVQNLSVTNDAHLLQFLAAVLAEQVCARMSAELMTGGRSQKPKVTVTAAVVVSPLFSSLHVLPVTPFQR